MRISDWSSDVCSSDLQFDAAAAPVALGHDPDAGLAVIARIQVFVMREQAVALPQAETARIELSERGDQQALRLAQWPPDPFCGASHRQTFRIVYFGAVVRSEDRSEGQECGSKA